MRIEFAINRDQDAVLPGPQPDVMGGAMSGDWSLFQHGADIGVEGVGATLNEAFANAAVALTATATDPILVRPDRQVELACQAPDIDALLVEWLNAVIYAMATQRMLFAQFRLEIRGTALRARAWGEPVDRERHQPAAEAKGATWTELGVTRDPQGRWHARCVVDV